MQTLPQFEATKIEYHLTELEARELRRELMRLRAEFVQITGVNGDTDGSNRLNEIEQKMCSIEYKLAHAEVIEEDVRQGDSFSFRQDVLDVISELKLKVVAALGHANKSSQHNAKK